MTNYQIVFQEIFAYEYESMRANYDPDYATAEAWKRAHEAASKVVPIDPLPPPPPPPPG